MPTVGHDAAMFARAGVASVVLLVRNQNGSHNPEEAMRMEDFGAATKVLGVATADLLAG
jgi:N-carbamoyl-L-amino-acid hydrolase